MSRPCGLYGHYCQNIGIRRRVSGASQKRPVCFPAREMWHNHTFIFNQMYINLTFKWTCCVLLQWCDVFETSETQCRGFQPDHVLTVISLASLVK